MISIVDDDESVRESTKALVRSLGYSARTFASAEEFLDSDPDETSCLILDVQMKGLSGVELLERLIAEGRRTPVIFVTAFPDERIRNHVLDAGAVGFLRKPFSDEKLTHCLDTALANYPSWILTRQMDEDAAVGICSPPLPTVGVSKPSRLSAVGISLPEDSSADIAASNSTGDSIAVGSVAVGPIAVAVAVVPIAIVAVGPIAIVL